MVISYSPLRFKLNISPDCNEAHATLNIHTSIINKIHSANSVNSSIFPSGNSDSQNTIHLPRKTYPDAVSIFSKKPSIPLNTSSKRHGTCGASHPYPRQKKVLTTYPACFKTFSLLNHQHASSNHAFYAYMHKCSALSVSCTSNANTIPKP